jgi:uncharacterized protein
MLKRQPYPQVERVPAAAASGRGGGGPAPWLFLGGTLSWSWAFWWLATFTGQRWLQFPTVLLFVLGAAGPLAVAVLLVAAGRWESGLTEFLRGAFDPRRLRLRWYAWILGLLLGLHALPPLLGALLPRIDSATPSFTAPIAFLLVGLAAGAVEEPGWRGYAQEGLQRRMPVLAAAVIIGFFWAGWHLPLFFLTGSYQHGLGVGTAEFWLFHLAILVASPIYGWLYNAAGGVALAAVLFHGSETSLRRSSMWRGSKASRSSCRLRRRRGWRSPPGAG